MKYRHLSNCTQCSAPIYGPVKYEASKKPRPSIHFNCNCVERNINWKQKFKDLENYEKKLEQQFSLSKKSEKILLNESK